MNLRIWGVTLLRILQLRLEPATLKVSANRVRPLQTELEREVARRRTFAIISHPDAGKTTLTEKLLLYAGAIELAGAVRGRKARRHATSDWMALEQERGISITAAALEFELEGRRMTLLDTPGHQDFSEDTYRALIAADSVVMVIDAANGVEAQTRKLFEVCRRHRLPILTFINKFDRPARDPLELLDDIERTLGIAAAPVNWPIGNAEQFRGVYDIAAQARCCSTSARRRGSIARRSTSSTLDDPRRARADRRRARTRSFRESLDVIRAAGTPFDADEYRAGRQTPVFFGSALTNFGLEPFLQRARRARAAAAAAPERLGHRRARPTSASPASSSRSRRTWTRAIAIASRSCASARAGSRRTWRCPTAASGKPMRASRAYRFFGRDRETISEAYAGDIIGLVNPGQFAIGDTLHTGAPLRFLDVPRFPAEHFGRVRLQDTRYKQFDEGLRQLEEEGLMQVFYVDERPPRADRRRRRRAAVRRDRQPAAHRVRRRGRRSSRRRTPRRAGSPIRRRRCRSLGGATTAARRPAGAARAAVRVGVGGAVLRAPAPDVRPARRVAGRQREPTEAGHGTRTRQQRVRQWTSCAHFSRYPSCESGFSRTYVAAFHSSAVISQISAGSRPQT